MLLMTEVTLLDLAPRALRTCVSAVCDAGSDAFYSRSCWAGWYNIRLHDSVKTPTGKPEAGDNKDGHSRDCELPSYLTDATASGP